MYKSYKKIRIIMAFSLILITFYMLNFFEINNKYWFFTLIVLLIINLFLFENKKIFWITYFVFLLSIIFLRSEMQRVSLSLHYLNKWIPLIFENKIVFKNVIGNILIFIPFGYFLSKKYRFLESLTCLLMAIFLTEMLQYSLKKGVFDLLDIILNFTGGSLGISVERGVKLWMIRKKRKKNKKN